jgi:hypothetical protein
MPSYQAGGVELNLSGTGKISLQYRFSYDDEIYNA